MIPLLQRKLFKEITTIFCIATCTLLSLITISRIIQMRSIFLGLELSFLNTLILFSCMIPIFLMLVIPIACMISTFLAFLRMSTDKELVALKAGGINIYQMLPAPMLFSILCSILTLWIALYWLAWGMGHFRTQLLDIARTRAQISLQPGVFNTKFPNIVIFSKKIDPETGRLQQVILHDHRQEQELIILAPEGIIETDPQEGDLIFKLTNGKIYTINTTGTSLLSFDEYLVRISISTLFKSLNLNEVRPRELPWKTLIPMYAHGADKGEAFQRKVDVEIHKRLAYPVACIALTLFVLPLSVAFEGIHRQLGIVLALIMFFIYYSLMSLGFSTGESGALPPYIGLWTPNLLFLSIGFYGIYLAAHERTPHAVKLIKWLRRILRTT